MKPATETRKTTAIIRNRKNALIALTLLGCLVGRTLAEELCGRTEGSAARDTTTGSVMMAGATVVGFAMSRDGIAFATSPTDCGPRSAGGAPLPDCNGDGQVTLEDYACLSVCMTGPDVEAYERCFMFDMDANGAIDLADARVFQNRFGEGVGG